ncbi:MAG: hypothetical protein JNL21_01490 [Myxococcales bacterium]|nr:hypothetical protein [Myxococcales bacterium]
MPARCPIGFADCDDTGRCDTDLKASSNDCGACGNVCPVGLVCGAGVCRRPEDIVQVAAGYDYTCALRAGGEVLCWGANYSGQLGVGSLEPHDSPMPVLGLGDAVEIDTNTGTTYGAMCARRATGTLVCWGSGILGQLGNGSEEDQLTPVEVIGVTEAASVKATFTAACALRRDGSVWCWGLNNFGMLGDGTNVSRSTAAPVVALGRAVQLDVAGFSCATLQTGEVACWGPDDFGWASDGYGALFTPAIAKNVSDAAAVFLPGPASHQQTGAYCVIHQGGVVSCTGENEYGNVDIDIEEDLTDGKMIAIEGVTDAIQVAGTLSTTCALRANGQVVCWGSNGAGLLGIGSYEQPEQKVVTVLGLEGVVNIAGGRTHMCAALGSGGVACWGTNQSGQLGDGTTESRAAPVLVLGLP